MKVWIVTKNHQDETGHEVLILGVYDNFEAAKARVDNEYKKEEEIYINNYGGHDGKLYNYGFAELHIDTGWDETTIGACSFDVNEDTEIEV